MKKMVGLEVESGIDKTLREGPVRLSFGGLDANEHPDLPRWRRQSSAWTFVQFFI
jgi:hypothetical protein